MVEDRADLVLLGRDERFAYDKLARMANEIERGALLVATNPDGMHPGALVRSVRETGAFLGAVLARVSPQAVRVIANPGPALFEESFRRLSVAPADCVMIGDNPDTDVSGAERVGIRTLLVAKAQGAPADDLHQLMDRLASWGVL